MIPKQWGTSDMCTAEQEEDILDVCDRKDAIVLGWVSLRQQANQSTELSQALQIHTHPQHPCFLSSMDLHTHCRCAKRRCRPCSLLTRLCSYQTMLPEASAQGNTLSMLGTDFAFVSRHCRGSARRSQGWHLSTNRPSRHCSHRAVWRSATLSSSYGHANLY